MEYRSVRVIQRRTYKEIYIQIIPLPGETEQTFSDKIASIIKNYDAKIIRATFFGNLDKKDNTFKYLINRFHNLDFPITWIEGGNCIDSFINGVYIFAVSGINVRRIYNHSIITGSYFETGEAEYCFLGGIYSDPSLNASDQTSGILNSTESILNQVGFGFANTVRTWYYLDDILAWYNDFNKARTSFFRDHDIFNKLVPASTGISGKNETGSRICLELNAIKPKNKNYSIERIKSPLQCSAENYGSSFSRAIKYSDSEYSFITVSGTASIDPDGHTAHINNLPGQIELSFKVIKAILKSEDFKFNDLVRAYAYCSEKAYSKTFFDYIEKEFPVKFAFICAENKICRDGLLFEIEMDVVKKRV